jgi:hypothetical protein
MPSSTMGQTRARSLLADIQGAPDTALPRRELIVEWLRSYLLRSHRSGSAEEAAETGDLLALEQFLRAHDVPAASPAGAN